MDPPRAPPSPPPRTHRELLGDNLKGLARLALLEGLTQAGDDGQARLDGRLGLGRHELVALILLAALAVAHQRVAHAHVRQQRRGRLARVRARRGKGVLQVRRGVMGWWRGAPEDGARGESQCAGAAPLPPLPRSTTCAAGAPAQCGPRSATRAAHLPRHAKVLAQRALDRGQVHRGGRDDDLRRGGHRAAVQHLDEALNLLQRAIRLPVTADEELARVGACEEWGERGVLVGWSRRTAPAPSERAQVERQGMVDADGRSPKAAFARREGCIGEAGDEWCKGPIARSLSAAAAAGWPGKGRGKVGG